MKPAKGQPRPASISELPFDDRLNLSCNVLRFCGDDTENIYAVVDIIEILRGLGLSVRDLARHVLDPAMSRAAFNQ